MVKEAEAHAAEDAKRREEADTRNSAEQLAYSTERLLKDNEEKLPEDVSKEVTEKVEALKKALEGEDIEAVKTAQNELSTASQKIGEALYSQEQAQGANPAGGAGEPGAGGEQSAGGDDEDIVDAEIVDEEEDSK